MLHTYTTFLASLHIQLVLWVLMKNKCTHRQNIFKHPAHMDQKHFHVTHMIQPMLEMARLAVKVDLLNPQALVALRIQMDLILPKLTATTRAELQLHLFIQKPISQIFRGLSIRISLLIH